MTGHTGGVGVTASRRGAVERTFGCDPAVVRLTGEHDASTVDLLSLGLAEAIARCEADVVVDLSDVTFMDASTVGCLVQARALLQPPTRRLLVRGPSRIQRTLLRICELDDLVETTPGATRAPSALESWVEVPALPRLPGCPTRSHEGPVFITARVAEYHS